jgi:hypothetical protein
MLRLMAKGMVPEPGVHPPELLARKPGFAEAFLAEYQARGVHVRFHAETL